MANMAPIYLLVAILLSSVSASPTPRPDAILDARHPMITPALDPTKSSQYRRDILSDLDSDVDSVLSGLGSDIPSYVASGVSQAFNLVRCPY